MSQHPVVLAAMREAIDRFGAGTGGTRNILGTRDYQLLLEQDLADLHGKDDALLYISGYVANAAALSTLAGRIWDCIVFCDGLNRALVFRNKLTITGSISLTASEGFTQKNLHRSHAENVEAMKKQKPRQ